MQQHASQDSYQMITAFFDKREDAERAIGRLEDEGVSRDDVQLVQGSNPDGSGQQQTDQDKSFLDTLKDWFMPDSDRESYSEGLRRGGYILRVDSDAARRDRIFDILDDEGTVNMNEREEEWRAGGWTGHQAHAEDGGAAGTGAPTGDHTQPAQRDDSHGRTRVRSYPVGAKQRSTNQDTDADKQQKSAMTNEGG